MYVIITQDNCSFCDKAKNLLKEQGLQFTAYNIGTSRSRWLRPLLLKADLRTVPQIFDSEGTHVGGFTELQAALK